MQIHIQTKYQPIDITLLHRRQQHQDLPGITIPLFSVHKIRHNDIEAMTIILDYNNYDNCFVAKLGCSDGTHYSSVDIAIHKTLVDNIIQAITTPSKGEWKRGNPKRYDYETPRRKFFDKTINKILKSSFIGIIPSEVKTKIEEIQGITEEVYLIKEAQWDITEPVVDPLVICVSPTGETFFVTSFDCTPVEYWAKQEHTGPR